MDFTEHQIITSPNHNPPNALKHLVPTFHVTLYLPQINPFRGFAAGQKNDTDRRRNTTVTSELGNKRILKTKLYVFHVEYIWLFCEWCSYVCVL